MSASSNLELPLGRGELYHPGTPGSLQCEAPPPRGGEQLPLKPQESREEETEAAPE
ncbi:hypothetical protein P7K49_018913, partial [Saguinus oedipus]